MAHQYLVINGACYVILGILFVTRSALQGLGRTLIPTLAGILELTMRVGAAVILSQALGFEGIVSANPLAWIGATMLLIPSWFLAKRALPEDSRARREVTFAGDQVEVNLPAGTYSFADDDERADTTGSRDSAGLQEVAAI